MRLRLLLALLRRHFPLVVQVRLISHKDDNDIIASLASDVDTGLGVMTMKVGRTDGAASSGRVRMQAVSWRGKEGGEAGPIHLSPPLWICQDGRLDPGPLESDIAALFQESQLYSTLGGTFDRHPVA